MSKRIHTLTLNRQGEFKILTTGESHCGTFTNKKLAVRYHLICECEKSLDQRGFLFEQVNIDQFFQNLKRTRLSCERLTMRCVKNIATLIRKDNPLVVAIGKAVFGR